ncbi:uncharacterized protein LOC124884047 isoform X2 [Girardinichthys multiradiatus]|uniref:uncharacterized protein LOC124884047 isoform X2 n=1 Tax=Girardinichthys multiradiatus TaxID=208333 RepID=UPI001FAD95FB|nr:uncharacterized protein LOC124884047 isoform X2 [Girardinichthys multiradiatus]
MADKELRRVRPGFVDKVSIEVIKQLLDGLLVDGVFNDGEKDSVLEASPIRAHKARVLIDKVKRKGPEASRRMIARLQKLDPTLYCELGLSSDQPAQPAPPVFSMKGLSMSKKDDPEVYPVTQSSFRNRVALLITNIKFSNESMNRRGAEIDEENMEKLLSSLGYEVVKYTDLTGKAIDEALMKFIKHPKLKHTDSVFVVIMSHGKLGKILGVNWTEDNLDEFPINNIFKHLGSKSCPELINKPKVIIIQACRGEQRGSVLVSEGPNTADDVPQTEDFEADKLHFVHPEKDFISLLSCTPDIELFRHHGSLFIRRIAKVFEWCSHHDDIFELFSKISVILVFPKYFFARQRRPIIRCTLTKRFYPSIARGFYGMGNEVFKFSESESSSSVKHKYHISGAEGGREEEAPRFQFCCEKCKAITQTHGQEIVTPQRISNGCFQLQLEEGQYECSVTGLVFEASERVLVQYSVLSWSKFSSFLSNSWKLAGPIFNIHTVDKDASVLTSIQFPHSICLAQSLDNVVPFSILHMKDMAFIEPSAEYSRRHVKWKVTVLSPVGPIIPITLPVEYHGVVLVYKRLYCDSNNYSFHVYLAINDQSSINDIHEQVHTYENEYIRIQKPAMCKLVEGTFHLSSEPEGQILPEELEFTLDLIKIKGYFEAVFEVQPPFKWSVRNTTTDETIWSAIIREDDCQANLKQKPRQRAKRLRTRSSSDDQNAYGEESTNCGRRDLSEKQLLQISKMLGSEWMQVAIFLGLMNKDLEDIKETERDVNMQKFKMLVKWKNGRKRGEATANDLWDGVRDLDVLPSEVQEVLQDLMDR